jgi:peptidoglycan/xylan/chitin deacetylase (PgdA/CDA1 family)
MRLDRFITLNLVHPFRQALVTRHSSLVPSLPILMYHSISDDPEPGVRPYYRVCTSPQRFREQMQWLKDNGYQGVTLSAGLAWLNSSTHESRSSGHESAPSRREGNQGRLMPAATVQGFNARNSVPGNSHHSELRTPNSELRPVALTFDDGFRDFYTHAFPILQQHGFSATIYLPTAFIGQSRRLFRPSTLNSQLSTDHECLTWDEVRELCGKGMCFGSHTVNHPQLADLSRKEIEHELRASKSELEQQLGGSITSFAYPFAFPQKDRRFKESFRSLLSEAGYTCCATTAIGRVKLGDDPYALKRLPVNSLDDPAFFLAKLKGGYDWLAHGQAAVKTLKRLKSPRWVSAN